MKEQNKKNNALDKDISPTTTKAKQQPNKTAKKTSASNKSTKAKATSKKVELPKFEYKQLLEDTTQPETSLKSKPSEDKPVKEKKVKANKQDKPKKKFNKRSFVSMLVLFVMGISSGLFAGNWYATNFIAGPATDYSQFTEAQLRVGNDRIANDYATKIPTANDAWKSFIAAEKNFASATSFDILSNGVVDTIITQTVYSRKIYNGETVFVEQISDGMVAVADRFVYKPSSYILEDVSSHIVRSKGKLNGTTTINEHLTCHSNCKHGNKNAYVYNTSYNNAPTTMTEDEYVEAMGAMPLSPIAYIVSTATVLSCGNFNVTGSGENTRYTFSMSLHSGASVLNYVRQMKTVSGLSDYPSFTEVKLDVSLQMLDGKVMFDHICVNEKYSVPYGSLTPKCTGTLHQRFLFNGDYDIPA